MGIISRAATIGATLFAMFLGTASFAQEQGGTEIIGEITAINDGMINGFTHCPIRTATINDLEIVWACGGPLPEIGSRWRVVYFESYPSGETLVSRVRVPAPN